VAALAGTLEDLPAAGLLRFLGASGRSGTVEIGRPPAIVVCLDDGALTFAGSPDLSANRAVLSAAGVLRLDRWTEALTRSDSGELSLAQALVGSGAVEPGALEEALYAHTVDSVFELLLPSAAPFTFSPAVIHPLAGAARFDVGAVLAEAEARLGIWREIALSIPSTRVVVRLRDALPLDREGLFVSREEWPVLLAIDGVRDVAAIIEATALSAFGVCGIIHRLLEEGAAERIA